MVTLPSRVECRGNKAFFLVPDCDGCIGIRNEHDSAHIPELVLTALISLLGPQEMVLMKRESTVPKKQEGAPLKVSAALTSAAGTLWLKF